MTYGKKLIFDIATMTQREEELTDEEKAAFDKAAVDHEAGQVAYAKVKYLDDRKRDPDWPTVEEKTEAIWSGDQTRIAAINARIKAIEAKYPAPQGDV